MESLWGDEYVIPESPSKNKNIIKKIKEPKDPKVATVRELKSKKLSLDDKLAIIKENVLKTLGVYVDDTLIITTRDQLHSYIGKAIENKIIAIDTETNNSLDPITCKLMGPCIYTPTLQNVYIPINHVDKDTRERLEYQLTEQDIKEEFQRLLDAKTFTVMHNGKFDYQVIKCTCGIEMNIDWDTMIGAKLLDENEHSAGLKQQYIDKIDPSIEKYSIDKLFEDVEYAVVDPNIFGLYAGADAKMTYKLYMWQINKFKDKSNAKLLTLAQDIEMPLVKVVAEMELNGVEFDLEYCKRLSVKYHQKLDVIDAKIAEALKELQPKVDAWRLTDEANFHPKKKTGEGEAKSKNEQLTDPINVASPTQLAILFYDVLNVGIIEKKNPRGTGEEVLEKIQHPIAKLLLERRGLMKLITAFIDSLPGWVNPKTGRIHCHFNAYGAATGRFSSSEPNLQQIPSGNHELRLLFKAGTLLDNIQCDNNIIECASAAEIMSNNTYVKVKELKIGDPLDIDNDDGSTSIEHVKNIIIDDLKCQISF